MPGTREPEERSMSAADDRVAEIRERVAKRVREIAWRVEAHEKAEDDRRWIDKESPYYASVVRIERESLERIRDTATNDVPFLLSTLSASEARANAAEAEVARLRAREAARVAALEGALTSERERIAARLEEEADILPCVEDAKVTRSNASLIRAGFSYDEAERMDAIDAPPKAGGTDA